MATKTDFPDSGAQRKTRYDDLSVPSPGHQYRSNATGSLLLNVVAWQSAGSCSDTAGGLVKASALVLESRSCTSRRSVAACGTQPGIHPLFTMSESSASRSVSNELSITRPQAHSTVQAANGKADRNLIQVVGGNMVPATPGNTVRPIGSVRRTGDCGPHRSSTSSARAGPCARIRSG